VLIFANKSDLSNAMDANELEEEINGGGDSQRILECRALKPRNNLEENSK